MKITKAKAKKYLKWAGVGLVSFGAVTVMLSQREAFGKLPVIGAFAEDVMDKMAEKTKGYL